MTPKEYTAWEQLMADDEYRTAWEAVMNATAPINLRKMGDVIEASQAALRDLYALLERRPDLQAISDAADAEIDAA